MKNLLARLQKCDPATWHKIMIGIPLQPRGQYHEAYFPFSDLPPEVACAWLQAVLQEACMPKNWHVQQGFGGNSLNKWAYVFLNDDKDHYLGEGNTPAQALLIAYIAAKEAT